MTFPAIRNPDVAACFCPKAFPEGKPYSHHHCEACEDASDAVDNAADMAEHTGGSVYLGRFGSLELFWHPKKGICAHDGITGGRINPPAIPHEQPEWFRCAIECALAREIWTS